MNSLNANKVKTNMFLVSIKLFIVLTTFVCHLQLDVCNNNVLVRYSPLLTTQIFSTAIFKPRLFPSHKTRLHTRLTEFLLLVVCFILPFYMTTQIV